MDKFKVVFIGLMVASVARFLERAHIPKFQLQSQSQAQI